jgi:hypothetical protein
MTPTKVPSPDQGIYKSVVITDKNYTMTSLDDVVIATAAVTVTLPPNPNNGEKHTFAAEGGDITLSGPLVRPITVGQGTALYVVFADGVWIPEFTTKPIPFTQVAWAVNANTGDDTGPGTPAKPLQTLAEFTRRLTSAIYAGGFGPYTIQLQTDIPATDSFQWTPALISTTGTIPNNADSGNTQPLVVLNGTQKVLNTGSVLAYVGPSGNAKVTVQRSSGTFSVADAILFTSGAAAGALVFALSVTGGDTAQINPQSLPGVPAPGDTFSVVSFSNFNIPLQNVTAPQGMSWTINNVTVPSSVPSYECDGLILTFTNSVIQTPIRPGIGSRFKPQNCLIMSFDQTLTSPSAFLLVERGTLLGQFNSYLNMVVDTVTISGQVGEGGSEVENGAFRIGTEGIYESSQAQCFMSLAFGMRFFDWPNPIPPNPIIGFGSGDTPGAALVIRAGGHAQLSEGSYAGQSMNAGTVGAIVAEGAQLANGPNANITVTGQLQDLSFDFGAVIPSIDPLTGLPVAGVPITSWVQLDSPPYNASAMNLANGTAIVPLS